MSWLSLDFGVDSRSEGLLVSTSASGPKLGTTSVRKSSPLMG